MKALTIWQPWASLIAIDAKPYEFRGWRPPRSVIGQRIAIHAGARPAKRAEIKDLLTRLQLPEAAWTTALKADLAIPFLEQALRRPELLPLSHMLCTGLLGEPRDGWSIAAEFGGRVNDSDREEHANWAWPLTDLEDIVPPVRVSGAQGLWNWGGP